MSGHVGDLSPKQETSLQQFKQNLKDVMKPEWDDHFLLRWLRARSFDMKKSEKMIRDNVEWRKRMNIEKIAEWEVPEVLRLYLPGGYPGEDKQGYPIWIDCLGTIDVKGIVYSTTKKDLIRYKAQQIERLYNETAPELSKKYGKRIDMSTLIFDMEGLGLKHLYKPAVDMFLAVLSVTECNYPEAMKVCYVINAPKIFPVMWNIAKPFLHEETKKKIKILTKNYKKQLLEVINADQLPAYLGGTATDPDGDIYYRSKIVRGGKIPEKYHLKNIKENIDMSNFENATVQRGSSIQLDYHVTEPGSTMRWQVLSEGNDLGFGVFKRTADERQKKGEMDVIVKSERVDSHIVPEEGTVILETPGIYVVRFDNTYSWVNAKKVAYLVEILPPDKENELEEVTEF